MEGSQETGKNVLGWRTFNWERKRDLPESLPALELKKDIFKRKIGLLIKSFWLSIKQKMKILNLWLD